MSVNKKNYIDGFQKRGNFSMVPNELWERQDLAATDKMIWCYIVSRSPNWSSSRNNIARNLHLGKDTVTESIKRLQSIKMLRAEKGSNNAWNFEIISAGEWLPEQVDSIKTEPHSGPPVVPETDLGGSQSGPHPIREKGQKDIFFEDADQGALLDEYYRKLSEGKAS